MSEYLNRLKLARENSRTGNIDRLAEDMIDYIIEHLNTNIYERIGCLVIDISDIFGNHREIKLIRQNIRVIIKRANEKLGEEIIALYDDSCDYFTFNIRLKIDLDKLE